jgi:DNA-binding transcriptional LysR family regulator
MIFGTEILSFAISDILVVAAEELNLRRAAQRLEITQPALTRQAFRLEEQIGISLFA